MRAIFFVLLSWGLQTRSRPVPAQHCIMGLGAVKSLLCLRTTQKSECDLKTFFFWRAQLSRHFFIKIPFPQRFELNYSLKISSFASAIEICSCWEKHPSTNVVTLWYSSCSSFAFSMGSASCYAMLRHCHCLRRLAVLAMTLCPCPGSCSSSCLWNICKILLHCATHEFLQNASLCSYWCVGIGYCVNQDQGVLCLSTSAAVPRPHFGCQIHSLVGLGVYEYLCYSERRWFRALCLWWDCVSLKFWGIYLPGSAISFIHPFYYRKITPRKPSLVITESFVSQHPHLPGMSDCMDWLLCFTVFPHLLPKAKVLPAQSAAQYKQLLFLVLVGPSLGYVHKKIFLF